MLDLFYPPKPYEITKTPDVIHSLEFGTMTAEQKRKKDAKAAWDAKNYQKRKTGTASTLVEN